MKKISKIIMLTLITYMIFSTVIDASVCVWEANGCQYFFVDRGFDMADAYINCGDGLVWYGYGEAGTIY